MLIQLDVNLLIWSRIVFYTKRYYIPQGVITYLISYLCLKRQWFATYMLVNILVQVTTILSHGIYCVRKSAHQVIRYVMLIIELTSPRSPNILKTLNGKVNFMSLLWKFMLCGIYFSISMTQLLISLSHSILRRHQGFQSG